MKVSDLIKMKEDSWFKGDKVLQNELIALDGRTGKRLFHTLYNKKEYIEQFMNGEVIALWADAEIRSNGWGGCFYPVMKCYVSHDSWKEAE